MYVGTEGQECTTGHVNPVESTSPLTAGKPLKAPGRPLEWTSNAPPALHKAWIRHQISGCHRGAVCLDKAMPAQKWGGGGVACAVVVGYDRIETEGPRTV
jgi:hypothetical protein